MTKQRGDSNDTFGTDNTTEPEEQSSSRQQGPTSANRNGSRGEEVSATSPIVLRLDGQTQSSHEVAGSIVMAEWAGPLPPPEAFQAYPPEVQEKILLWSDTQIMGTQKRADYIAETERIAEEGAQKSKYREQLFTLILDLAFLFAAAGTYAITGNIAALGFLALPSISIAVNIAAAKGRNDKE